ncbi:Zdhhc20 [Symbiodinium sp. CCMP2456]|nr:Zdhhc20 [Symbiodinium sp. CCMP2456]
MKVAASPARETWQDTRYANEASPDTSGSLDVAHLIILLTKSFAVILFVYGGYAYNAIFLSRILLEAGKESLVLPFAVMFNLFYILGLLSYVAAAMADPGFVPERWLSFVGQVEKQLPVANPRPEWQPSKATRCKKCNIIRPERAHHCHFCRRCILRMDHHCPWINNCVGMYNHKYFTLLGIYAGLASFIALSTILPDLLTCLSSVLRMDSDVMYGPAFTKHAGYLQSGNNVLEAMMTIHEAKEKCAEMKTCKGFCYIGEDSGLPLKIYFKDKWQFWSDNDSHWTSYRYAEATGPDDAYVFQFLLLGCVVIAANALLVPLNCSHLPNLLDNVTMIESNYDNMPNPFDQGSRPANMAQIFGSPGIDWIIPIPPLRPLTDGICFAPWDTKPAMALVLAASTRDWAEVERLLKVSSDVNQQDRSGQSCLMWTAQWDNLKIVRLLLERRAAVDLTSNHGVSALMFAADSSARDIVRLLLKHQASPDEKSRHGMNALLLAAKNGAAQTIRVLLEGQADINAKGAGGMTALMFAAADDHVDAVQVLLDHGADVNVQNRDRKTALILATQKNATLRARHNFAPMVEYVNGVSHLPSVLDFLLAAQSDLELQDREGKKALDYAGGKAEQLLRSWPNRVARLAAALEEEPRPDDPDVIESEMSQWDLADTLRPMRIRSGKKQKIFGEVDTTPSGEAAKRCQKLGRSLRWSDGLQVEPPPEDASQLWHFWGGGGNTGMSGQMTNNPELTPSENEETRMFHFSHKGVAVSVSERRRQPKDPLATDYTGDLVWPTAVAFSRYICEKHGLEGTRALDVGAGTGLVGLVVHRMGAKSVTFTDVPRVIPLLSRNVALHCLPDATRKADPAETQAGEAIVRPLLWGEAEAEALVQERGHFDLVLCCEVVYQQPQQVWQSLQAVLKRVLARPGGRVVFAYQHRDGAEVTDAQFFETLEEACGVHLESEESLSAWDDAWDDIDFRWVRTYVATAAAQL